MRCSIRALSSKSKGAADQTSQRRRIEQLPNRETYRLAAIEDALNQIWH
jgi:hypothetical protein